MNAFARLLPLDAEVETQMPEIDPIAVPGVDA